MNANNNVADHHNDEEHHNDVSAQWRSASRKIIDAEITGYEVELSGLRGEALIDVSANLLEAKIEALKLLAEKFA